MNLLKFFLTLNLVAVCSLHALSVNAEGVNGQNVGMVVYSTDGKLAGAFAQSGPKTWVEIAPNATFTFEEIGRDKWSVYIRKLGRQAGQTLQLDLYQKTVSDFVDNRVGYQHYKIAASFGPKAKNPLVKFEGASSNASEVNGKNVALAIYANQGCIAGALIEIGPRKWMEYNNVGKFTFGEMQRDDWTLYLTKSDGLELQVDLHAKSVKPRGGAKLYDIVKVLGH